MLSACASGNAGDAADDGAQVQLLTPGEEPRTALRYDLQPGFSEVLTMDMNMDMDMRLTGVPRQQASIPTMRLTMELEITEITAEGDLRSQATVRKVEAIARAGSNVPVATLQRQLEEMNGLTGWTIMSTRGVIKDAGFTLPADMSAEAAQQMGNMEQQMRQLSFPLPEEPVGKGAMWKVSTELDAEGVTLTQDAIYWLVDLEGQVGELEVTLTQNAPPQKVTDPTLPAGTTAELTSMVSEGTGTMQLDLTRIVPTSSLRMSTTMELELRAQGQRGTQTMTMDLEVIVKPAGG
jgi:hypothetical protein